LRGELGVLDGIGDVVVAPKSLDLGVEAGVAGLDLGLDVGVAVRVGDGDLGDDETDFSQSYLSAMAPADVLV
jgi:hypothetical protein